MRRLVVIAAVLGTLLLPSAVRAASFIGPAPTGPTSGSAWTALKAAADASPGTPNLCDQNNRTHPKVTLAAAIVYARTGVSSYRTKAINGIDAAYPTQVVGCGNAVLALGRQLGAYVLAADYVGYRGSGFVSWLTTIRTKEIGGHGRWHQLRLTSGDASGNWATFALASVTVADAYLADTTNFGRDWKIFKGYGDGTWTFRPTASYDARWNCGAYRAIEPGHCGAKDQNGVPAEDASRGAYPVPSAGYVNEAMQGYALQAIILARQGYDAFGVNSRQVCRASQFQQRYGIANAHNTGYYAAWVWRKFCPGSTYPLPSSAPFGRVFGFTDWFYA